MTFPSKTNLVPCPGAFQLLSKVFSLFLDALTVLIETHKDEMHENLYFLMSRLLNKLGADLLGSVQAKTLKTLDLVRYYYY